MVLIGLLLVAVVCLALGLVLASAAWLIGSLAATAVAAYVMWKKRKAIAPSPKRAEPKTASTAEHEPAVQAVDADYQERRAAWFAEGTAQGDVWVIDGKPDYHAADCRLLAGADAEPVPFAQATEDGFTPCAICSPVAQEPAADELAPQSAEPVAAVASAPADMDDVWVVDGKPDYHRSDCAQLAGADAEPIPRTQATEDGFTACAVCRPAIAQQPADVPAEPVAAAAGELEPAAVSAAAGGALAEVWVVDGHPRYHRADCLIIKGQGAELIAHEQATDDGFTACTACEPDATRTPEPVAASVAGPAVTEPSVEQPAGPPPFTEPVPAAAVSAPQAADGDVWVVDGRPDYHLHECPELIGADAEPIPFDQATEDGFTPCPRCQQAELAEPAAGPAAEPEPVVEPEPMVEPEPVAEPEPAAEPAAADYEPEPPAAPESEPVAEPVAAEPEPVAEPVAAEPERPVVESEPAAEPEPAAAEPAPVAAEPLPEPAAEPEPVAASAGVSVEVWVIDGRPRYHRSDCMIINGQQSRALAFEQATEEGFKPCSLCEPNAVPV